MRVHRSAVVIPLLALTLAGAACAKKPQGAASGPRVVLEAASATAKARTAKIAFAMDISAKNQTMTMSGDGVIDYVGQLASMKLSASGKGLPAAMNGIEMIFSKGILFMKAPELMKGTTSKPWIKMDLKKLTAQQGFNMPGLGGIGSQDPTEMLTFTRDATDIKEAGSDDVRGVATTHYTMNIDMQKAMARYSTKDSPLADKLAKAGLKSMPAELWVDDTGKVRRMKMVFDMEQLAKMGGSGAGSTDLAGAKATMSIDFFDFGTPVDVKEPPASDVTDFSEMMGGGGMTG